MVEFLIVIEIAVEIAVGKPWGQASESYPSPFFRRPSNTFPIPF